MGQIQIQIQVRPRPRKTLAADAPTISRKIARTWFPESPAPTYYEPPTKHL